MIDRIWNEMSKHYACVGTDNHIVMPNHVHGIINLNIGRAQGPGPTFLLSLFDVMHRFKSLTTNR
ncbi:MAG: hypothetical protein ABIA77_03425, partial [Candidatus Omnitrophota bacterium]